MKDSQMFYICGIASIISSYFHPDFLGSILLLLLAVLMIICWSIAKRLERLEDQIEFKRQMLTIEILMEILNAKDGRRKRKPRSK